MESNYESPVRRLSGSHQPDLVAGRQADQRGRRVLLRLYEGGRETTRVSHFRAYDAVEWALSLSCSVSLFANRVLPKNRPEYHEYISWLALDGMERSEFDELARTGGRRATDAIELIPCPEPTASGEYETYFFCRGLRHLAEGSRDRVNDLKTGAPLYLMRDVQNAIDASALLLRTGEPVSIVGYTPAYFSSEFAAILDANGPGALSVSVERVNLEAPMQYRILCRLVTRWPDNFAPFSSEEFQDYSSEPMSNT